jgi:DNA-binding NarL/FixJ family response regulator
VPTCVLIADRLRAEDLLAAIECGVAAVVPRAEADPAVVVEAILAVSQGSALLPAALQGELFAQLARLGDDLREDHDLTLFGLAAREREVLRMIADGWDTREISERLWCSVATVKNVLSGLMTRLRLKSRTHAVAYAIRTGVI